jgi:hypothetical protein
VQIKAGILVVMGEKVEKTSTSTKTKTSKRLKWLQKNVSLITLIISVITLILAAPSIYNQWFPQPTRAKLTIFIDYNTFTWALGDTSWSLTSHVKVVNDSPMTATIRTWDLTSNFNMTYEILDTQDSHLSLILQPSSQTDFNLTRAYTGMNNTMLPFNSLRSIVVEMSYEDALGIQAISREYGYVS